MNAAVRIEERLEQRCASALMSLESLLEQDSGALVGTRGLAARLVARRLYRFHRVALSGASWPQLAARLCVSARSEPGIVLSENLRVNLVFVTGEQQAEGCDAHLVIHVDSVGGLEEALSSLLKSEAYRRRYWLRTVSWAREIIAALLLHLATSRAACLARRDVLSRALARPAGGLLDRAAGDTLRAEIGDTLGALTRRIQDDLKRALGNDGRLQASLTNFLERLDEPDLGRETGKKAIRLTIKRETQSAVLGLIRELTATEVATRVADINTALESLDAAVGHVLAGGPRRHGDPLAGGPGRPCAPLAGKVAEAAILDKVSGLIQVAVKYRGNLPRRGFFHRLAEGRRSVFTVLMFFSLFGSFLGFNWRSIPVLGWLFLCGFVVAVISTYRSWVEEDRERIEEELEKARDHLQLELRRVLAEILRELGATLTEAIEQLKRSLLAKLDEAIRDGVARAQREAQEAREAGQLALKQLELKERQAQEPLATLTKLDGELALWLQQMPA